jgi:hypothetical protein
MAIRSMLTALSVLSIALGAQAAVTSAVCNADNCARAVTGTRRGSDFPATASAD